MEETTCTLTELRHDDSDVGSLRPMRATWAARLVHFYTASGAVLAFLALDAIWAGNFRVAFLWLLLAMIVDASDGWLARRARVGERTPEIDGALLDNIVDYLTYVLVPVYLLYEAGRLPDDWGLAVASAVLLAGAYGFARTDAKTADGFFVGFPSYWNVVALYLFAFGWPLVLNAAVLLLFCALVFVRIAYVYPSKTPVLRGPTVALGALWAAAVVAIVLQLPQPSRPLLWMSLLYPLYYFALSLVLHGRRRRQEL